MAYRVDINGEERELDVPGEMPLLWLVNGVPIETAPFRRQAEWRPDGMGLARVTVIDRAGRAASAEVWVR